MGSPEATSRRGAEERRRQPCSRPSLSVLRVAVVCAALLVSSRSAVAGLEESRTTALQREREQQRSSSAFSSARRSRGVRGAGTTAETQGLPSRSLVGSGNPRGDERAESHALHQRQRELQAFSSVPGVPIVSTDPNAAGGAGTASLDGGDAYGGFGDDDVLYGDDDTYREDDKTMTVPYVSSSAGQLPPQEQVLPYSTGKGKGSSSVPPPSGKGKGGSVVPPPPPGKGKGSVLPQYDDDYYYGKGKGKGSALPTDDATGKGGAPPGKGKGSTLPGKGASPPSDESYIPPGKGKGSAGKGYVTAPLTGDDDSTYDPDGDSGGAFSYVNCAVPYLGTGPIPADMWLDQAGCLHMLPPVPLVPGSSPSPAATPAPRPTLAQVPYTSPPWFDALGGAPLDPPPTYGGSDYVLEPVLILQQLASDPTSD